MIKGVTSSVAALRTALRVCSDASSVRLRRVAGSGVLGGRHGGAVAGFTRSVSSSHGAVSAPAAAAPSVAAVVPPVPFRLPSPSARRHFVLDAVREQAASHSDAFYVVDLMEVARKFAQWRAEIPRARPFFAVKCNDDPRVVATLAQLGAGFDCASKGEMAMVTGLGVPARDIIFAHPAKQSSHIAYAKAKGITRMTFDNEDELRKIAREYPGAEVVLRILTDDSASVCRLGLKFGCPLSEVPRMMAVAKDLGVKVAGISYHVGSGNGRASSFGDAVRDARTAFDIARAAGHEPTLLDIGGGFPGSEMGAEDPASDRMAAADSAATASGNPYSKHPSFSSIAAVVREALDTYFPVGCGVDIIAEPGRYFVKSSHTLAVNVIGKRCTVDEATGGTRFNYYVNEGLYGSFNCILYDHVTCSPSLLLTTRQPETVAEASTADVDDSIARVDADGTIVIEDAAVGSHHAADLAVAVAGMKQREAEAQHAAVVEALMNAQQHAMYIGGGRGGDEGAGVALAAAAGAVAGPAIVAAARAASAAASSRSSGSSSLSFHSLASGVRHASSVAGVSSVTGVSAPASTDAATVGGAHFPTTLWGNTCDSIDKITDEGVLPELHVGDWLVFENMGAYTVAGSCKFNGFPVSTKVYLNIDGSVDVGKEEVHA